VAQLTEVTRQQSPADPQPAWDTRGAKNFLREAQILHR